MFVQEPKILPGNIYLKSNGDVRFGENSGDVVIPPKPVVDCGTTLCIFNDGTIGDIAYNADTKKHTITATKNATWAKVNDAKKFCRNAWNRTEVESWFYIAKDDKLVTGLDVGATSGNTVSGVAEAYYMGCSVSGDLQIDGNATYSYYMLYLTTGRDVGKVRVVTKFEKSGGTILSGFVGLTTNFYDNERVDSTYGLIPRKSGVKSIMFPYLITDRQTVDLSLLVVSTSGEVTCRYVRSGQFNNVVGLFTYETDPTSVVTLCSGGARWATLIGTKVVCCDKNGSLRQYSPKGNAVTDYTGYVNPVAITADVDQIEPLSGGGGAFLTAAGKVFDFSGTGYVDDIGSLYAFHKGSVKTKIPFHLADGMQATGFVISGEEPENTKRRVMFSVDGVWNKLSIADGVATLAPCTKSETQVNLSDDEVDDDYVLENGNTAAELSSVTSVPAFTGKDVYVKAALYASEDAVKMPSFALGINAKIMKDTYVSTQETREYALGGDRIARVEYTPIAKDGGSIEISATIRTGEEWSKELSLDELKGLSGDAIKFKVKLSATTIGVSQAGIAKLSLTLRSSERLATATGNASLTSKTQVFDIGMTYGRLYVKHGELRDAKISADIMFRETPKKREMYKIAEGTGKQQTVTLADTQVDFSTLQLFANNDRIPVFDFNSMENTVTFIAPDLSTVFATYEYEVEPEDWQPMQAQGAQGYTNTAGYASTSFAYQVTGTEKGYSAVRVNLEKPEGSVQDALLGIGTGRIQTFFLPHYAKVETLKLKNGTEESARKNWSYDQESRALQLIALKDREVTASYEYAAESPKVYGFVAAWNQ